MKVSHPEATKAHLDAHPEIIFVDVRSRQEFASGHPAGSVNIPLLEPDASGAMAPNPEFVSVFQAAFPDRNQAYVLTCRSGGRSGRAGQILEQMGYTDMTNMDGGIAGNPMVPGWETCGLPVATDGETYDAIKARLSL